MSREVMTNDDWVTKGELEEMKRRGWVTYTWKEARDMASAARCPFCRCRCYPHLEGKDFPNEQNAEYHCPNWREIE